MSLVGMKRQRESEEAEKWKEREGSPLAPVPCLDLLAPQPASQHGLQRKVRLPPAVRQREMRLGHLVRRR